MVTELAVVPYLTFGNSAQEWDCLFSLQYRLAPTADSLIIAGKCIIPSAHLIITLIYYPKIPWSVKHDSNQFKANNTFLIFFGGAFLFSLALSAHAPFCRRCLHAICGSRIAKPRTALRSNTNLGGEELIDTPLGKYTFNYFSILFLWLRKSMWSAQEWHICFRQQSIPSNTAMYWAWNQPRHNWQLPWLSLPICIFRRFLWQTRIWRTEKTQWQIKWYIMMFVYS